jgi:Ca2+/Na+ antiporter
MKHHVQEYNRATARMQAALLFLATIALLVPSLLQNVDAVPAVSRSALTEDLSLGLAGLLIVAYMLGMLFTLRTHREFFGSAGHHGEDEAPWPMGVAAFMLAAVTVVVALVSEVFVASVQEAAVHLGLTPAFVGFIVVALVGGAAEMASAFAAARKDRLDLSVGIALGAATQIALFVAPVLVLLSYVLGPSPMDLTFWPGAIVMMLVAALTIALVTSGGKAAWFLGVLVLMVYLVFAMTLYLLPPPATGSVRSESGLLPGHPTVAAGWPSPPSYLVSFSHCQPRLRVLKSVPVRTATPVLYATLRDCDFASGSDSVAPIRAFFSSPVGSASSTRADPPRYHVASNASQRRGRNV